MADQKDQEKQDPGFTDQEKKEERERAGQNPYDKDQAANPERGKRQDPQYDPSHIKKDDPNDGGRADAACPLANAVH